MPFIASEANGDFVVVWHSYRQDGDSNGIFGQRFQSNGLASGQQFQVNSFTTNGQSSPAVSLDADGNFVVVWQSSLQDGSDNGIFGQRFGTPPPTPTRTPTSTPLSLPSNPGSGLGLLPPALLLGAFILLGGRLRPARRRSAR